MLCCCGSSVTEVKRVTSIFTTHNGSQESNEGQEGCEDHEGYEGHEESDAGKGSGPSYTWNEVDEEAVSQRMWLAAGAPEYLDQK